MAGAARFPSILICSTRKRRQVTDRNSASELENVKWRKPVAMLVNGGTRSGKEILAYGFKKYGLGEVIGSRTEGAVLAATAFLIDGGLLLLAVGHVQVDGERLEGDGVAPTIEVQADPASMGLVILNSIVQSQSYPWPDPREATLPALPLIREDRTPQVKCCVSC
ncbi:S41 family peptidase [Bradyrhizobium sp. CCGUVB23]|uniref:S41 family peptidase n=1 Tax=Bradyrhizobium sp. CCGUVB23 TaxID=2949630 RepID=UPI00353186AD